MHYANRDKYCEFADVTDWMCYYWPRTPREHRRRLTRTADILHCSAFVSHTHQVPIDTCTPVVPEDASVASYHVEGDTLRVGEFCEVDNAPGFGFLFGRIKETGLHAYTVSFPFGDRGTMENVPAYSVRRALVFDMSTNEWREIDPDCDPSTSLVGDPTMLPLVASRHMKTLDVHHDAAPVVAGADRGCRGWKRG